MPDDSSRSSRNRARLIAELGRIVCWEEAGHPVRVAVDGVTASGKSTLARELTAEVIDNGRSAIHLTMDGFHNPRRRRYRQGRLSADGYYDDAYDFQALVAHVLAPLGPGGDRRYRPRVIDLASDQQIDVDPVQATEDAVVIVDGTFLQRPELADWWDERIYVETTLSVAYERGTHRDADELGGLAAARRLYDARYHAAARLYIAAVNPAERATIVVENDDLDNPRMRVRSRPPSHRR